MFEAIYKYFDKLEDRVRSRLSHSPIIYAALGGIGVVLFWRGVWGSADILMSKGGIWAYVFYEPVSLVWITMFLLMTGVFVSFFIGDRIILSGIKQEKKLEEKTEAEIRSEGIEIRKALIKLDEISKEIEELKELSRNAINNQK